MESFNDLKLNDKVKSKVDGAILTVRIWRGKKYFAGNKDMWEVSEFDPADWEKA